MNETAKMIIIAGFVLVIVGLLLAVGGKYFPIGKIQGDIRIEKENFKFYFPLTSSIIISIILTVIAVIWFIMRR